MALVVESAAAAVISQLVDTVLNYANASWWPSSRSTVKTEAKNLQAKLPQIRLLLAAIQGDRLRQKNPDFDARLWQFRDALEAAHDVLDKIKYYELEEKARESEVSGPLSGTKRKLVDFVKNVFVNDGVLDKLREAVKELEAIASDMGFLIEIANNLNQQLAVKNFRETGSLSVNSSVVGRETEKETIVRWLTAQQTDTDQDQPLLPICSIYGMGGMGKTTLAQLVCSDQRVVEKFDQILWVCVSDNSDVVNAKTIIRKILEDLTKKKYNLDNLSTLQNILKAHVASNKFLLVLDDIWGDDTLSEWEKVVAPLRFGERGSGILLTTRMKSVTKMIARVMEGENKCLYLAGLAENDFMSLFYSHAFAVNDPNKYHHLRVIGDKIAKKLWACPLAAKVIGGVLNNNLSSEFWNKVLNEDILNIQTDKNYIVEILKLSYYYLPTHLQLCFRYCSIFPQDYVFRKDELIEMWTVSGLISSYAHNGRPEDIAAEYLDQLTKKSFFYMRAEKYLIHDLLHDVAQNVAKGECSRIIDDTGINIPRTTRHLYVKIESIAMAKKIRNLNKLQTLVIICVDHNLDLEQELNRILSEVKSLRLLRLHTERKHEIPSTIADLIHLRYLSISSYDRCGSPREHRFFTLKQIYNLYNLQVLKIQNNFLDIQESVFDGMSNLINLRYFDFFFSKWYKIPSIGKLCSLQELSEFFVGDGTGYKIGELKNLLDLRKLCVYGLKNISSPEDAREAEMYKKEKLKSLVLCWDGNPFEVRDEEVVVADNLKPHTNLINLEIRYYSGYRSPYWMADHSYSNLVSVELSHCDRWENLPPLGQLNLLEILSLRRMSAVKQVGYSFYGNCGACIFPSLRILKFSDMPEWEEWVGPGDKLLFPCLNKLEIVNCPKLKRLPMMPTSLRHLVVNDAALNTLPRLFQAHGNNIVDASISSRPSLSSLHIENCPNIVTLVGCHLLQQPEDFHALTHIIVAKCINLLHIDELLVKLPCLTDLTIIDCPKLATCEIQVPTMLTKLAFGSHDAPEHLFSRSLQDLTCLVKLEINGCPSLQHLPPAVVFAKLIGLRRLNIQSCERLASLSGLEALTALMMLEISECEMLNEVSLRQPPLLYRNNQAYPANHHLRIENLYIDHTSLLLIEPLKSLMLTRTLTILKDSQVTSLPEIWLQQNRLTLRSLHLLLVPSLQALPSMEAMCSLQFLSIRGAKLLRSLRKFPTSLISLDITGCSPELEDLCQRETGFYWPIISCIPEVCIWAYRQA